MNKYKYKDLTLIKHKYGEKMSHLCYKLFPTLLETEGQLYKIITASFYPSRFLYNDIVDNGLTNQFQNYIYSFFNKNIKLTDTEKTPRELLNEKNYELYECLTQEDINKFTKYYIPIERLCTFKDNRLKKCYVFFAVKKDLDKILREEHPSRDDKYGTSVISIQFSRGKINHLSIKNRYNDTVKNADATFGNNLENIIPGLTKSFEKKYNLNINNKNITPSLEIPNYIQDKKGKYYKYNYEINNIYYCPNNIIIDNDKVIKKYLNKSQYLIIDYFIVDIHNKTITTYPNTNIQDSFINTFSNIKKITIKNISDNKTLEIEADNQITYIKIDAQNRIIGYKNDYIKRIDDNFLKYNTSLKELNIQNVTEIASSCLQYNKSLEILNIPNVKQIGEYFLYFNNSVTNIFLESIENIDKYFMCNNNIIKLFYAPRIKYLGKKSFLENKNIDIKICLKIYLCIVKNNIVRECIKNKTKLK